MHAHWTFTLCALFALSLPTQASTEAFILGGGYSLQSSQGQIEANVRWLRERWRDNDIEPKVYFTDGDSPTLDVHFRRTRTTLDDWGLIALIFGDDWAEQHVVRNHRLGRIDGSSDVGMAALQEQLQDLGDGELFFSFHGHGDFSSNQPLQNNTLELWDNQRITVDEFAQRLNSLSAQGRFRYVFTQCFAGAFHELIFKPQSSELRDQEVCGFSAVSAYDIAEGCSASIDGDDYRDYASYFFAALHNSARFGAAKVEADLNNDGRVSPREAHFYTLGEAVSSDVPIASSEYFLSKWAPWLLRYLPNEGSNSNEYGALASHIALRYGWDTMSAMELIAERRAQRATIQALGAKIDDNIKQFSESRQRILATLLTRWPMMEYARTQAYHSLIAQSRSDIAAAIREHADFARLQQAHQAIDTLVQEQLTAERQATQLDKYQHLRELAQTLEHFQQFASSEEQAHYQRLVNCEEAPLR